jgi:hypothetical protein
VWQRREFVRLNFIALGWTDFAGDASMSSASPMKGQTPVDTQTLMRAVDCVDVVRVRSLLAAGADVNAAGEGGETALMRAVSKGNLEIVEVLLDAGSDVHVKSENGFTPLFMAVFFGYADIARALLARGSDPAAQTRVNTTAEKWAQAWGSAEIIEVLKDADAIRAQGSAEDDVIADEGQTDSPPIFFPADGEIRPVVPLSEIAGTQGAGETTPLAKASTGEPRSLKGARAKVSQRALDEQNDDQDETTLVPARPRRATLLPDGPAPRPKGIWQSWPVMLIALALSAVAGLSAGAYLIESRQPVATKQSMPQLSEPSISTEPESATASVADVETGVEADAKAEKVIGGDSAPKPSPKDAASLRAPVAGPSSHRIAIVEARPERAVHRVGRGVDRSIAERPAQRDAATATRVRIKERPSATPAPPKHSLPVSSPPPSAKSKKVIQWP